MKKGKENYRSDYIWLYSFVMQECKAVEIHSKAAHSCFQKPYCTGSARQNQKKEELQREEWANDGMTHKQRTNMKKISCALVSHGKA